MTACSEECRARCEAKEAAHHASLRAARAMAHKDSYERGYRAGRAARWQGTRVGRLMAAGMTIAEAHRQCSTYRLCENGDGGLTGCDPLAYRASHHRLPLAGHGWVMVDFKERPRLP